MATQKVEIELSVKSNAGQAAKDMGTLADNTRKAGQAAQQASANWRQGFAPPGGGPSNGWNPYGQGAMPGYRPTPGAPGGMMGRLAPFLTAAAGGAAMGSAANYIDANRFTPENLTFGRALSHGIGSLPIVGGAWRFADATVGGALGISDTALRSQMAQSVNEAQRFGQGQAQIQSIEAQGRMQLMGLDPQRSGLLREQRAAEIAQRIYNDSPAGRYVTEDRLGESTSQTGGLRLGVDAARADRAAAILAADEAAKNLANQRTAEGAARENAARANQGYVSSVAEFNAAQSAVKNKSSALTPLMMGLGGAGYAANIAQRNEAIDERASLAAMNMASSGESLKQKNAELSAQEAQTQERIKQSMEAQATVAQKNYALAQAELGVLKDQLNITQQKKNVLQSAAEQALFEDEATKQDRLLAIQKFQTQGPQSLNPDEVSLVRGYAPAGQMVRDAATAASRTDTTQTQINQLLGLGTLDQAAAEAKKLAEEANQKQLEINTKFRKEMADTFGKSLEELGNSIKQAIVDSVRAAKAAIEVDRRSGQVGQPAGT